MALLDVLRPLLPVLAILPIALAGSRRVVVRQFERAAAYSPAQAVVPARTQAIYGWWLARLIAAGVLKEASRGRLWLDQDTWAEYRAVRRRRGLNIAAALLFAGAVLLLLG